MVSLDFKTQWKRRKKRGLASGEMWPLLDEIKDFLWWGVEGRRVIVQAQRGRFLLTVKDCGQVKVMFVSDGVLGKPHLKSFQFTVQREKLSEVRRALLQNQSKQRDFRVLFGQVYEESRQVIV